MKELKEELVKIKERNLRVETDKAWEVSNTRRGLIAFVTYIIIVLFLIYADIPNPYLVALIPALGYLVSTLTLPFIRNWWIETIYRK